MIENPRNKKEVYWSVLALRDCGTDRCIAVLKGLLHYPKQDVKACSILTIAQIAGAEETALYAEALLDPKYSEKAYALWAIWAKADGTALHAVYQYIKKNLSKICTDKLDIGTYGMGVEYMIDHMGSDQSCVGLLQKILDKKIPTSPAEESLVKRIEEKLSSEKLYR